MAFGRIGSTTAVGDVVKAINEASCRDHRSATETRQGYRVQNSTMRTTGDGGVSLMLNLRQMCLLAARSSAGHASRLRLIAQLIRPTWL